MSIKSERTLRWRIEELEGIIKQLREPPNPIPVPAVPAPPLDIECPLIGGGSAILRLPRHLTPVAFDAMVDHYATYLRLARPAIANLRTDDEAGT